MGFTIGAVSNYGRSLLTGYDTAINAGYTKVMLIGDSWMRWDTIPAPIRATLQTAEGDGGIGYRSFHSHDDGEETRITAFFRTGTWTETVFTGNGIGLKHVEATAAASFQIVASFTDCKIHYRKQSGYGVWRWRIDGGGWTNVDENAATAYATEIVANDISSASHTVDIEWVSGTVQLFGIEMTTGTTGLVVYRCGCGGALSQNWSDIAAANWQAAIDAFAPDLVLYLIANNDHGNNINPEQTKIYVNNLIDKIRGSSTNPDIVLISPAINNRAQTYPITQYAAMMYQSAYYKGCGYIDGAGLFGAYNAAYWSDSIHLNDTGGSLFAGIVTDYLA